MKGNQTEKRRERGKKMAHSPNSEIVETNPFTHTQKKSVEWSKNKVNNHNIQIKPRTQISFVGEARIWVPYSCKLSLFVTKM